MSKYGEILLNLDDGWMGAHCTSLPNLGYV